MEFLLKTHTRYVGVACGKLSLLAPHFQLPLWYLAALYRLVSRAVTRMAHPLIQPW
jgi:hypothetical protein